MKKWMAVIAAALALTAIFLIPICKKNIPLNHPSENKYPVRGVDVSHYQGDIDFKRLEQQGMRFAFIKATEGSSHVDSMLEKNIDAVRESGMRFGFYHFSALTARGKRRRRITLPTCRDLRTCCRR